MRDSQIIIFNAGAMWAARALNVVPQLILVPFLLSSLGERSYGVYVLVWSLMVGVLQFEQSFQSGVVKISAEFLALERLSSINKVLTSALSISFPLALITCGSLLVASFLIHHEGSESLAVSVAIVAVAALLLIPLTPYVGMIQSTQRYYIDALAETFLRYVGLLVLIAWFSAAEASVTATVAIMSAVLVLTRIVQAPLAYRLVPSLRFEANNFDWTIVRRLLSFGSMAVLLSISLTINNTGVKWIMGVLATPQLVAHLAIMLMPVVLLSQMMNVVSIPAMPAASGFKASGKDSLVDELVTRGVRYTTIIALPAVLLAALLLEQLLTLWVGSEYAFLAPYSLTLIITGAIVSSTSTCHHALKGTGKLRAVIGISLTCRALIPVAIIAVANLTGHSPYISVVSGLAVGNLLQAFLEVRFSLKELNTKSLDFLRRGYLEPLLPLVAILPPTLYLVSHFEIAALAESFLVTGLAIGAYLGSCYLWIFSDSERQLVWRSAHNILERLGLR